MYASINVWLQARGRAAVTCSGLLWFIAGVTHCHAGSPEERASVDAGFTTTEMPSASAIAHSPRDAGNPTRLDALCATLLAEEKIDPTALNQEDRTRPGPRVQCLSTGTFAWAIRADRLDTGTSIRQTLLFAGNDGARARLVSSVDGVEWPPVLGRHAAMFDFDGDGLPEFFALIPKDVRTFTPASRIFVTMKKGAIAPYPTGGSFLVDGMVDMDKDGRPDLRVSFALGKRTVCEPIDEGPLAVELAAHSLPDGKFSLTDPAAVSFAERRCPAATDTMFIPSGIPTASDPRDLSMAYVACARLRGRSADDVVAELQASCAPNADATKKCSGPCRHLPDAIAVAKFAPPLRLTAISDAGKP